MLEGDFHAVEFALVFFDEREVAFDKLVEKVVEKTFETRETPLLGVGDALDEF